MANRTDYDLKKHQEHSGVKLSYFDPQGTDPDTGKQGRRYVPFVIEPSAGVDRSTLAFLVDAYVEEEERTVLRLHPRLAPIKVGIFPLLRKQGQPEKAHEIQAILQKHMTVVYDQAGAVGRRYRRQDEIGTPFCITVDHQTADDDTVTLRHRDSMEQERVKVSDLLTKLLGLIHG